MTAAAQPRRAWKLRQLVAALVFACTFVSLVIIAAGVLALILPDIEREHRALVTREAQAFADRQEQFLKAIERRLTLLAEVLAREADPAALLELAIADDQTLDALYLLDGDGRVRAVGLPHALRERRNEVLGNDLSRLPLLREFAIRKRATWSDRYTSPLSGDATVGLALRVDGSRLLLAELPLPVLLRMARPWPDDRGAGAAPSPAVWLIDGHGEVLVDSEAGRAASRVNLLGSPLLQRPSAGQVALVEHRFVDGAYHVAVAHSGALDWTFIARIPALWHHPRVQATVWVVAGAFAATIAVGLLLAPLFSRWLVRHLQQLVAHAGGQASGRSPGSWQHGPVREFNQLADSLDQTTRKLREREQELTVILDAAPVPMAVRSVGHDGTMLDANEAWCRMFGYARGAVVGRPATSLRIWRDEAVREQAYAQARAGRVDIEAWLLHADGHAILCRVSGRLASVGGRTLLVWANEDITEERRRALELRELNTGLEARVEQRTQALAQANRELQGTLDRLQATRDELLRAEKLAALGRLVAGVAHELNTPLGNSLMAVTTLRDEAEQFRTESAGGLRRAALERLLEVVEQATAISVRNLERAAELLTGFKQVAADGTSAQRRRFDLAGVIGEIVMTLRPSFSRKPYTVETDVEAGLQVEGYPGALGQVLTNLVTNAVVHGFEGRDHGRVRISGRRRADGLLQVEVSDDGIGIAPELMGRIFDPFVTTRMGRGGTGLGLNIAHNAATRILGGTLEVRSNPGQGATFTLVMPATSPRAGEADELQTLAAAILDAPAATPPRP